MSRWDIIRDHWPKLYRHGIIFECGTGWFNIILDLSKKIEKIIEDYEKRYKSENSEEKHFVEMYAVQVKEKCGTLRFYMSCDTLEITNLIEEAEALSSRTCENCGSPGKMRGNKWVMVKCDDCFSGGK